MSQSPRRRIRRWSLPRPWKTRPSAWLRQWQTARPHLGKHGGRPMSSQEGPHGETLAPRSCRVTLGVPSQDAGQGPLGVGTAAPGEARLSTTCPGHLATAQAGLLITGSSISEQVRRKPRHQHGPERGDPTASARPALSTETCAGAGPTGRNSGSSCVTWPPGPSPVLRDGFRLGRGRAPVLPAAGRSLLPRQAREPTTVCPPMGELKEDHRWSGSKAGHPSVLTGGLTLQPRWGQLGPGEPIALHRVTGLVE